MSKEPVKAEPIWVLVALGVLVWISAGGLTWYFWNSHDVGFPAFLGAALGFGFVYAGLSGFSNADPPLAGEKGHGGGRKATQAEAKEKLSGKEQRPSWADHHYQD
jgi:hypothetical protein